MRTEWIRKALFTSLQVYLYEKRIPRIRKFFLSKFCDKVVALALENDGRYLYSVLEASQRVLLLSSFKYMSLLTSFLALLFFGEDVLMSFEGNH